ncbi:MAG: lysine-sensitive aspartokinase 3 [Candidatus Gracilibacteria bacterium]|jgi:aspartate kinase
MSPTVAKFGGTSMGTAQAISQVADIMKSIKGGRIAVVSATSGTTDRLLELCQLALAKKPWETQLQALIVKHEKIIKELDLDLGLKKFWKNIGNILEGIRLIQELSLSAKDRLISTGERISSKILAALLNKQGIPALAMNSSNFIFTDNNFGEGNVDFKKTYKAVLAKVKPVLKSKTIPVITGFIGQSEDGRYITLGRGGSDYTGAIIGAALNATEVQIWTDVDGIFNTDPRLCKEAKVLDTLSFNEAGELAYFGAKVLHPKTIKPAIEKNIPVKILNTFNPKAKGTVITNKEIESLKSVTAKKGITIVNICSAGMFNAHGFLARIFEIFAKYKIVVDVVSTSEVSVSLTIDKELNEEALQELKNFSNVTVYENMAIVCLVGSGIRSNTKVLGELFTSIKNYDVSMVSLGASKRNITFLVKSEISSEVVSKIFHTFFNKKR